MSQLAQKMAKVSQQKSHTPLPDPHQLLERLQAVDCSQFDLESLMQSAKGKKVWFSALAIPISALLLMLFTLIGAFAFNQPIWSFVLAAALLFAVGLVIDSQQKHLPMQVRQEVMQRIAQTEGEEGLVPHFRFFLPPRYRHLWQSLRKGNYVYIEQYIQAITLLQNAIKPEKFIQFWHLKYPETAPKTEPHPFAEVLKSPPKSPTKPPRKSA
ncbi:MAG: hypothetical protein JXR44_06685 [Thiotrichales bacterium]|nr:hypothetical protein [Thiotrichales bacterium]